MGFYDAAIASWKPATFNPLVAVVYVERSVRDWRWLWLRKTTRGEVAKVIHDPPVKVKLSRETY